MHRHPLGLAVLAIVASCGDNASQCGEGTTNVNGVCLPTLATVCGDGTKLESGQCVVDPETCQAGTVLIANRCVDPTSELVIDLEESLEPNALAIASGVEASASPAGVITLKPTGETVVVHGRIAPFRDGDGDGQFDPDFDTYLLNVAAPTLLNITVDGVGGTQGAFYLIGDPQGTVRAYERYGLNLTGDTSKRRLFLPAAGLYQLAIADTRTLGVGNNPPPPAGSSGAAGGPFAEYYASITVELPPASSVISVVGGAGNQAGALATDEVEFFTAQVGAGSHDIQNAMPGAAAASLTVINAGQFKGYADETPGGLARLTVDGIAPDDVTLIAVDAAYNYGPAPEPFTLTIMRR